MEKQWYTSKTLWFNVVTIFLGTLAVDNTSFPIEPQWFGFINGIGNLILRMVSGEPISFGKVSFGKK